jgi:hypothetical protein
MIKKNLVILIVVIILIIIAGAGYYAFSLQKNTKQNPTNNSATDIEQNILLDKEIANRVGVVKPINESSPIYQEISKDLISATETKDGISLGLNKVVGNFAIGGIGGNGGGEAAVFAKVNGKWKKIAGTQDVWYSCKSLFSVGITPTIFAQLDNQKTDDTAVCEDFRQDGGDGNLKAYKDYYEANLK